MEKLGLKRPYIKTDGHFLVPHNISTADIVILHLPTKSNGIYIELDNDASAEYYTTIIIFTHLNAPNRPKVG